MPHHAEETTDGDDPEVAMTMKRIKSMDAECQLSLRVFALVSITLGICFYCMYTDSTWLLVITMVCACCSPVAPMLVFPLFCSLVFYILSHIPTMEQIFTVAEDIYEFHQKYKR
jgi:hypothetical protein